MNQSYITFNVRPSSKARALGLEVLLDNDIVYNNQAVDADELISVKIPDDQARHSLKIVLKNKTAEHTVLDAQGAIVQDSTILVENIQFDGIDIGHNILALAIYTHDCNGSDHMKQHKFYGEMGCNGTVELEFSTPIYHWFLENM